MGRQRPSEIIFYDGECGLCNRFVRFMLAHAHKRPYGLAPLQGKTAQMMLDKKYLELNSVVYWHNGEVFVYAQAVRHVLDLLAGLGTQKKMLQLCPPWIANWGYRIIARNRHLLGDKNKSCVTQVPEGITILP